uniref:Uncharacterized protein n=1 Tax=Octopus bimaculoides TaxID=37653 RepID=A0A0L8FVE6_OCTBM
MSFYMMCVLLRWNSVVEMFQARIQYLKFAMFQGKNTKSITLEISIDFLFCQ